MDARTRKALKSSIKHWEENVAAESPDDASTDGDDCALCELFWSRVCTGCPVRDKTKRLWCGESPYGAAERALKAWHRGGATKEQWQEAARAELEFLKSLLPEGDAE